MCQFKSGLVLKNGTVLHSIDTDSHEDLIKQFNVKDDGARNNFVRVEIIPLKLPLEEAVYKLNLKTWGLKVDQDNIPDWWKATEKHAEKEMLIALKETVSKRCLLKDKSIEEIKNNERWVLIAGKVNSVSDSATINYVHDSATINSVHGSATINSVHGSATINSVHGSATINSVYDSATINSVYDLATINSVYDSATINSVHGLATINSVHGSATINSVYGSAKIKDVKDNSVILISRDNGKLKIRTALEVEVVK